MLELKTHGVEEGDLGTHSYRKVVATMVASGFTLSPPIVSICLVAGWVMRCIKDRFLKYASSGNHYVGRCKNCADHNSFKFAVSTPHLDFSSFEILDRIFRKKELKKFLYDCLYQLTDNAVNGRVKYLAIM